MKAANIFVISVLILVKMHGSPDVIKVPKLQKSPHSLRRSQSQMFRAKKSRDGEVCQCNEFKKLVNFKKIIENFFEENKKDLNINKKDVMEIVKNYELPTELFAAFLSRIIEDLEG